jgi:hypothetical protein
MPPGPRRGEVPKDREQSSADNPVRQDREDTERGAAYDRDEKTAAGRQEPGNALGLSSKPSSRLCRGSCRRVPAHRHQAWSPARSIRGYETPRIQC